MNPALHWLRALVPPPIHVSASERLRACCGALAGLLITGLVVRATLEPAAGLPLLVAPMGASAVLLFALPSSPLAQPWPMLGGNMLSALVGVSCAHWIGDPVVAAALAVGAAIALMFLLRCLHPPGGAVALLSVVGGPAIAAQGYAFALWPVGLNSLLLLLAALAFHRLTRHRYPHAAHVEAAHPHQTADALPTQRIGISPQDLRAALRQSDELLDIAGDDLQALIAHAERKAFQRQVGELRCRHLMSRDVVTVRAETPLPQAWRLLRQHAVRALPVIDAERRVIGLLSQSDFFAQGGWREGAGAAPDWRRLLRRLAGARSPARSVADLMSAPARTECEDAPMAALVPAMSDGGLHQLPIVDADGRLQGIVTQSDLIAALYRARRPPGPTAP